MGLQIGLDGEIDEAPGLKESVYADNGAYITCEVAAAGYVYQMNHLFLTCCSQIGSWVLPIQEYHEVPVLLISLLGL